LKSNNNQQIAFRVDASATIGTGHFMRCFTLANQLLKQGHAVTFISRHYLPSMVSMLQHSEIPFKVLPPASSSKISDDNIYADWLGTSQFQDAEDTITALLDAKVDWIIVDHYSLDCTWEVKLRPYTDNIMVIDDLANRKHACDLLLDQNYYPKEFNPYLNLVSPACRILLGPKYALLRPEFAHLRAQTNHSDNQIHRVLIFFGGIDEGDYTSKAIKAISALKNETFAVDVVIGDQHPNKDNIVRICQQLSYHCHVQTNKMAELIAQAYIGIGAGGSSTWERCALGLPTITLCVADNQRALCQNAASAGAIYYPDWTDHNLINEIRIHFEAMLKNPFLCKAISQNAMQLVDTNGTNRIASLFDSSDLKIRLASIEDIHSIFEWRNHPDIRAISRNKQTIDWNKHEAWFEQVLIKDDIKLLLISANQKDVGVVRFDLSGSIAEISIYLVPDMLQKGLGTKLLDVSEKWLQLHHPEINEVTAEVLDCNSKSKHFFIKNGYVVTTNQLTKRLYQ
jgi:UDP-2,4-diacetamido-2,4,6-trideoxy-beta-L-altropyranose hydrolase